MTTALTTFVTAILVAGDDADDKVAARVREVFQRHYSREGTKKPGRVRYLVSESEAERLVFSENFGDISGWGAGARTLRARRLSAALKTAS